MQNEVKAFNAGKKKTIKKTPLIVAIPKSIVKKSASKKVARKKAAPKKSATKKHLKYAGTMHSQDGKKMYKYSLGKKPTENTILNKIHKVKKEVDNLDEAQHKHMSIGSFSMIALKDNLERLKFAERNLKNTQENIKISKNIHSSSVYINSLKKNEKMYKDLIKEIKIHITQLKKHI